jgi:CheY-like chemotaxis protein
VKKRILLVDDTRTALLIGRAMIAEVYEVLTARDGREALLVAERDRPDAIVMDVVMPEMDGVEACHALRARAATRTLPILLVTTPAEAKHLEERPVEWNGCLTKPYDKGQLLARLRALVGD